MGSGSTVPGRPDDASTLALLVDGLIERLMRSPLMRRAPAQCTPEEQFTLAQLLGDLSILRKLREEIGALPQLRAELLNVYWPELGALLLPARRGSAPAPRGKPREAAVDSESPTLFDVPAEAAEATAASPVPAPAQDGTGLPQLLTEALTETGRALNTTQMLAWLETRGVTATRETVIDALFRHEDRFRRRGNSQWVVVGQEASS